mgnify:CR=1 FL=1
MDSLKNKISMTGDRPTGPLHLGHYVGSLIKRIEYQEKYLQYIMIADAQAMTDNSKNPSFVKDNIIQVSLDYLSTGIDPEKSTIFIQSMIPALSELTMIYLNLVTWNRLKHNPTVKQEIIQKGFGESIPAGFMIYPISQAADITAFNANYVPVGEDQNPMIEQANEIVRSFNRIYGNVLTEVESVTTKNPRLIGIDGKNKMSKSLGNAIFLSDTNDIISKKVKKMYTDPNHIRIEDPGSVDGNVVFSFLDTFDPDKKRVEDLKKHYQQGGLGDGVLKKYLVDILVSVIEPIRRKRAVLEKNRDYIFDVLKKGTHQANQAANLTLTRVKKQIGIFDFT